MSIFKKVLEFSEDFKASDVHFTVGKVPCVRIDGSLIELEGFPIFTDVDFVNALETMNIKTQWIGNSYDTSYRFNQNRMRVHLFLGISGWSISMRLIPSQVPKFEELGLPDSIKQFTKLKNGLILVTGVTGSGKSTTLTSIIQMINETQSKRIITIEDPVEFVYEDVKSVIVQRELGHNFSDFSSAVKEAMRQDPDIIVVGELRDLDTIKNAITLAETGHLVFGTLHTKSVAETFDRIIDVFPNEQQKQIRHQISNVVEGIITQRLLKKTMGGRVPATEVLVMNNGTKNIISNSAGLSGIEDQILMNHQKNGSQTMLQSLAFLVKQGLIDIELAHEEAGTQENIQKLEQFLIQE
ncbi:type IV pilus twitching motility protein PilT [Bacillus thuringiensis]|uniref:type IV pilus twitching motility protein PilT n=1 Tax=Bacillus thuringiensis TaxID=1428 RepID=UPI0021D652C9|nr:PilT/PilU family type 4a pilus ATPase [Bacillus thuringiensis]MCU7667079.1 PilT/PilU family type 4a pilus ATPase [Bacillus thuringiensis]